MRRLATTILLASLALCAVARAELPDPPRAPSDEDVARARQRFVRGMTLATEERWGEALDEFERSYALSGSPVALFNLASTLSALGRSRDARDAFDRLLAHPELDEETRVNAQAQRIAAAAQVARVSVSGVPDGDARVLADGAVRETTSARPVELELDPGARTLAIDLPAYLRWEWAGMVEPGARFRLTAHLDPPPNAGIGAALPWIVGAAAALVAGAIAAIVIVDVDAQLDPRTALVITLP